MHRWTRRGGDGLGVVHVTGRNEVMTGESKGGGRKKMMRTRRRTRRGGRDGDWTHFNSSNNQEGGRVYGWVADAAGGGRKKMMRTRRRNRRGGTKLEYQVWSSG